MQSGFPLPPKQLQWAFVQSSIKRPSTVLINLSYSGPETASFLLVILQSGWKGRNKSCLGNIKRQSEWKKVQKMSMLYWSKERFSLGQANFVPLLCYAVSTGVCSKTPSLFHSQFHYDAGIDTKIKNLHHKHVVWLCIWKILGSL